MQVTANAKVLYEIKSDQDEEMPELQEDQDEPENDEEKIEDGRNVDSKNLVLILSNQQQSQGQL
jgi:hypothetical protein